MKLRAILGVIFTIIIAVIGISTYSSHDGVMTWFGIELSEPVFYILIAVFAVFDVIAVKNAFGAEKKAVQAQTEAAERAKQRNADNAELETPCQVILTRKSSMVGAAMGVQVQLNGESQGVVKNGQSLQMSTRLKLNELSVLYNADQATRSVEFEATAGGHVEIELKYTGAVLTIVSPQ